MAAREALSAPVANFGEHHCRAPPSAFVVAHFADRFARRLHCQLADLALGLPRCLTFLPREGKAAGHSLSAVDDLSVPGAEQRVPIWSSQSVFEENGSTAGLASMTASTEANGITGRICMLDL